MDYDKNIDELTKIIEILESKQMPLSEEIELFRQAEKLYFECNDYLEKAKGNIYKIKKEIEQYKEEKFNSEDE